MAGKGSSPAPGGCYLLPGGAGGGRLRGMGEGCERSGGPAGEARGVGTLPGGGPLEGLGREDAGAAPREDDDPDDIVRLQTLGIKSAIPFGVRAHLKTAQCLGKVSAGTW